MNTYAVGDIHGHYDQLIDLMEQLPLKKEDVVVFLGDYVDGGPDVKKVLDQLIQWKEENPHWKFLFGNHESLLLDAFNKKHPVYGDFYLWWNQGGRITTESFKRDFLMPPEVTDYERALLAPEDVITKRYLDFLNSLDLYYENEKYFFIHGGVMPGKSLADFKVELDKLTPQTIREGDLGYYGLWVRDEFLLSEEDWGKKIVFGHTVFPHNAWSKNKEGNFFSKTIGSYGKPLVMDNKIGLDQMHWNEGNLIAVKLPEEKFFFESSK